MCYPDQCSPTRRRGIGGLSAILPNPGIHAGRSVSGAPRTNAASPAVARHRGLSAPGVWVFVFHLDPSIPDSLDPSPQARIARRLLIRYSPGDPAELGSENSCACD